MRHAEATEHTLRSFNAVLSSMSPNERAEAEQTAQFGRTALGALRPPRRPLMFGLGLAIFGIGVIAGIAYALAVGTDSAEFQRNFPFFLAAYAVGVVLTWLGK